MTRRLWELDALRGLMLVLMTCTHLPTRYSGPLGQPFGFVSAAEGFVLLSGVMAGMVYTARQVRQGEDAMRSAMFRRVWKIYVCQAALLMFLFTVVTVLGVVHDQQSAIGIVHFFLADPVKAGLASLLLIYKPPLLDILPIYIFFMAASPLVLGYTMRRGWQGVLLASAALWLAAQLGLREALYGVLVAVTGLDVPYRQTGAFDIFAWQLIWTVGLWLGATRSASRHPVPLTFSPGVVRAACAFALVCLVWRHAIGQVPFGAHNDVLNALFNKWHLGPLRLLNLAALSVVVMTFGMGWAHRLPRLRALETMGSASLPVFCAHLVLVLVLLALAGDAERGWLEDGVLLVSSLVALWAVAAVTLWLERRGAKPRVPRTPGPAKTLIAPGRQPSNGY